MVKRSQRRRTSRKSRKRRRVAIPVWKRINRQLTPTERSLREKSLKALALVRREKLNLRDAAEQVGLEPETVIGNTNAFRKIRGEWTPTTFDHIARPMVIYEKGRKIIVEIADSRIASSIGEYFNVVKKFLNTGQSEFLREVPRKRFKDLQGKYHTLEMDPRAILAIKAREPKPEFFEIYRW